MPRLRMIAPLFGGYLGQNHFASFASDDDLTEGGKQKRRVAGPKPIRDRYIWYGSKRDRRRLAETAECRRSTKRELHRAVRHGARVEVQNEVRQAYLYNLPEPPALSPGDYPAETWTEEDQKRYEQEQRILYSDPFDDWYDNYDPRVEYPEAVFEDEEPYDDGTELIFDPVDVEKWAARDKRRPHVSWATYRQMNPTHWEEITT